MGLSSFTEHYLAVQLTLSEGAFSSGQNSTIITDLAMSVDVEKLGPPDFAKASVEIYGMDIESLEHLTTLAFNPLKVRRNYINIFAGDSPNELSQIFAGSITESSASLSGPEMILKLSAEVGFWGRVDAKGPATLNSPQSVSSFVEEQAGLAELTFSNEGVDAELMNGTFSGSPIEKARKAAEQAGCDLVIDDNEMILLPKNGNRKGDGPLINSESGLLDSPSIGGDGISFTCIYNPNLRFAGLFKLESIIPKASGIWRVVKLNHKLQCNMPGDAQWVSEVTGYYPHLSGEIGKFI